MSDTVQTLLANNVDDVLTLVDDYQLEDLKLALEAEKAGQNRKGVTEGLSKKIAELEAASQDPDNGDNGANDDQPNDDGAGKDEPTAGESGEENEAKETPKKAVLNGPVDGLGRSLKPKKAETKSKKKSGPVDGRGKPL